MGEYLAVVLPLLLLEASPADPPPAVLPSVADLAVGWILVPEKDPEPR